MESTDKDPVPIPPDKLGQAGEGELAHGIRADPRFDGCEQKDIERPSKRGLDLDDELTAKRRRMDGTDEGVESDSAPLSDEVRRVLQLIEEIKFRTEKLRNGHITEIEAIDSRVHAREAVANSYKFSGQIPHNAVDISKALKTTNVYQAGTEKFPTRAVVSATSRLLMESEKTSEVEELVKKASEITKKNAILARHRIPKQPEPPNSKCHWDYLLDEMLWMAGDVSAERHWKRALAKNVSSMITNYWRQKHEEYVAEQKILAQKRENGLRSLANQMANSVKNFWVDTSFLRTDPWVRSEEQTNGETEDEQGADEAKASLETPASGACNLIDTNQLTVADKGQRIDEVQPEQPPNGYRGTDNSEKDVGNGQQAKAGPDPIVHGLDRNTSVLHKKDDQARSEAHASKTGGLTNGPQANEKILNTNLDLQAEVNVVKEKALIKSADDKDILMNGISDGRTGKTVLSGRPATRIVEVLSAHRNRTYPTDTEEEDFDKHDLLSRPNDRHQSQPEDSLKRPRTPGLVRTSAAALTSNFLDLYRRRLGCFLKAPHSIERRACLALFLGELAEQKQHWGTHLIVTRSDSVYLWKRTVSSVLPGFKCLVYDGNEHERAILRLSSDVQQPCHIVVTSYRLLLEDMRWFLGRSWAVCALDESQNVKDFSRLRGLSRWITVLLRDSSPLACSLPEAWSILECMLPETLLNPDVRQLFRTVGNEGEVLGGVLDGLSRFDVGSLTPVEKISLKQQTVVCGMTTYQRHAYEKASVKNESLVGQPKLQILRSYARLRRVCEHPGLAKEPAERTTMWLEPMGVVAPLPILNMVREPLDMEQISHRSVRIDHPELFVIAAVDDEEHSGSERCESRSHERAHGGLYGSCLLSCVQENSYSSFVFGLTQYVAFSTVEYHPTGTEEELPEESQQNHKFRTWTILEPLASFDLELLKVCFCFVERAVSESAHILTRAADHSAIWESGSRGRHFLHESLLRASVELGKNNIQFLPGRPSLHFLERSGKIKKVGELLRNIRAKPCRSVVITPLVGMATYLQEYFDRMGERYVMISDTSSPMRCMELMKAFTANSRISVLLVCTFDPTALNELVVCSGVEIIVLNSSWHPDLLEKNLYLGQSSEGVNEDVNLYRLRVQESIESSKGTNEDDGTPESGARLLKRVESIFETTAKTARYDRTMLEGALFAIDNSEEGKRLTRLEELRDVVEGDFSTLSKNPPEAGHIGMAHAKAPSLSRIQAYAVRILRLAAAQDDSVRMILRKCDNSSSKATVVSHLKTFWKEATSDAASARKPSLPSFYNVVQTPESREQLSRVLMDNDEDLKLHAAFRGPKAEELRVTGGSAAWSAVETLEDLGFFTHAYARLGRTNMVTHRQKEKSAAREKEEAEERQKALDEKKRAEAPRPVERESEEQVTEAKAGSKVSGTMKKTARKSQVKKGAVVEKAATAVVKDVSTEITTPVRGKVSSTDISTELLTPKRNNMPNPETTVSSAKEPAVPWNKEEDAEITFVVSKYGTNPRLLMDWMNVSPHRKVGHRPRRSGKLYAERAKTLTSGRQENSPKKPEDAARTDTDVLHRHLQYLIAKKESLRNKQTPSTVHFLQPHASHGKAEAAVKFMEQTPRPIDIMQRYRVNPAHVPGRKVQEALGDKRRFLRSPLRDESRMGNTRFTVSGEIRRGEDVTKSGSAGNANMERALQKSASNASLSSSTTHRISSVIQKQPGVPPGSLGGVASRPPPAKRRKRTAKNPAGSAPELPTAEQGSTKSMITGNQRGATAASGPLQGLGGPLEIQAGAQRQGLGRSGGVGGVAGGLDMISGPDNAMSLQGQRLHISGRGQTGTGLLRGGPRPAVNNGRGTVTASGLVSSRGGGLVRPVNGSKVPQEAGLNQATTIRGTLGKGVRGASTGRGVGGRGRGGQWPSTSTVAAPNVAANRQPASLTSGPRQGGTNSRGIPIPPSRGVPAASRSRPGAGPAPGPTRPIASNATGLRATAPGTPQFQPNKNGQTRPVTTVLSMTLGKNLGPQAKPHTMVPVGFPLQSLPPKKDTNVIRPAGDKNLKDGASAVQPTTKGVEVSGGDEGASKSDGASAFPTGLPGGATSIVHSEQRAVPSTGGKTKRMLMGGTDGGRKTGGKGKGPAGKGAGKGLAGKGHTGKGPIAKADSDGNGLVVALSERPSGGKGPVVGKKVSHVAATVNCASAALATRTQSPKERSDANIESAPTSDLV